MQDKEKKKLILSFCQRGIFWPWLTARAASDVAFRIYSRLYEEPIYPTPLHIAVYYDIWELANIFIKDINEIDGTQSTSLHIVAGRSSSQTTPIAVATENGYFEVVRKRPKSNQSLIAHCGRSLIEATRRGSLEMVKFLYEEGTSLESKGKFGQTALHKACIAQNRGLVDYTLSTIETAFFKPAGKGHVEIFRRLLEAGTDATILDGWRRIPLQFAAMYSHPDVVSLFLKKTAINQNIPDWVGRTVLHNAAAWLRKSQEDVIDIPFEYKAEAGRRDKWGMTALYAAILREKGEPPPIADLIEHLIHHHVPIDARDIYGRTTLYLAVATQHAKAVRLLLKARADTNDSSLHEAVRRGDSVIVRIFLEIKPWINLAERDWEHQTPLHIAAKNADKDILTQLLNADAPAQQGNPERIQLLMEKDPIPSGDYISRVESRVWERSLLHWLAAEGEDLNQVLLDRSTLAQDVVRRTPLHLAVMSRYLDTVQQLISAKADTNIVDESSLTPLHYAAESQETAILQAIILAPKVNIDKTDKWDQAALYLAAHRGNLESVRILLDAGASLTPDYARRTLLDAAIDGEHDETSVVTVKGTFLKLSYISLMTPSKYGHLEVVKELLTDGAMPHVLDNNLFLAAHFAAEAGYAAIVEALLDAIPANIDKCLSKWQERPVRGDEILGSAVLYTLSIEGALEQVEHGWYLARPLGTGLKSREGKNCAILVIETSYFRVSKRSA
ncbi:hypothetical protein GQX73_g437 [Xylaria multiplex]|uniref:Uncharacterized protein n=1 Tax=Xylaria multiplex TaxID=323545 RepID=A0A7C8N4Q1_9PEZI|nr:hypothetical protein GQX73_g437 [Xylaria multiplex]